MDPPVDLYKLALALGLGLLVGVQREWAAKEIAGVRTFGLITVLGALAGLLAAQWGGWIPALWFVGVASLLWAQRDARNKSIKDLASGITTEISALIMFSVGLLVALDQKSVAVVVTGATAVLLHWKTPLHNWVRHIDASDLRAIMRLVLIGLVILPALPDRSFGPLGVLNPFRIWLMVVMIVGISVLAYLAQRLAGPRVGTFLAGVLGGLISSTATTVTYARRTRERVQEVPSSALVLILASTTVFLRVLVEVAVVGRHLLASVGPPLIAMMVLLALVAVATWKLVGTQAIDEAGEHAPSTLGAAIVFGLLYAAVLLSVAGAKMFLGTTGLYLVAALSGLTDMDAITLSTAELASQGRLPVQTAWRLILVGALANLAFKAAVAAVLGHPRLRPWILGMFGASLIAGLTLLAFWPDGL